jgi:hypothetical protein
VNGKREKEDIIPTVKDFQISRWGKKDPKELKYKTQYSAKSPQRFC